MDVNDDITVACAHLVARTGATGLDIGYTEDTPPRWWAAALYRGARVMVDGRDSPTSAVLGLAMRLLSGAQCKCGRPVTLSDGKAFAGTLDGCRWRLMGNRWEPGCDAPPVRLSEAEKIRRHR